MAPSPTIAITTRSAKAKFRDNRIRNSRTHRSQIPGKEAIMPRLIFKLRANQFADEPESELREQFSGRRGESSQKTRCGLIGWASLMALASSTPHHCCNAFFDSSCARPVALPFKYRDEHFQCRFGVADQIHSVGNLTPACDRRYRSGPARLHLPWAGTLNRESWFRSSTACRNSSSGRSRLGTQQTNRTSDKREFVGQHRLSEQALWRHPPRECRRLPSPHRAREARPHH